MRALLLSVPRRLILCTGALPLESTGRAGALNRHKWACGPMLMLCPESLCWGGQGKAGQGGKEIDSLVPVLRQEFLLGFLSRFRVPLAALPEELRDSTDSQLQFLR